MNCFRLSGEIAFPKIRSISLPAHSMVRGSDCRSCACVCLPRRSPDSCGSSTESGLSETGDSGFVSLFAGGSPRDSPFFPDGPRFFVVRGFTSSVELTGIEFLAGFRLLTSTFVYSLPIPKSN